MLTSTAPPMPRLQKFTKSQHQAMKNLKRKTNMALPRVPQSHHMTLPNTRMNMDHQKLQQLATRRRHMMLRSLTDPMDPQPINQSPNTSQGQSINPNPNIGQNPPTMQSRNRNISPNPSISQNQNLPTNLESLLISQDLFTNQNLNTSPITHRRNPKRNPSQSRLINQI